MKFPCCLGLSVCAVAVCVVAVPGTPLFADSAVAADTARSPHASINSESEHAGTFGGERIRYKAIVAESDVTATAGEKLGSIGSISYLRTDDPAGTVRPVVFVFNGGPGSASLWLHMGLVGPKRVDLRDDLHPQIVPPFRFVDNAECPLDAANVVMIDPPGTGFATVVAGKEAEIFTVEEDGLATARFIQGWSAKHGQNNAPKFLLGESYGTIRAAKVARLPAAQQEPAA